MKRLSNDRVAIGSGQELVDIAAAVYDAVGAYSLDCELWLAGGARSTKYVCYAGEGCVGILHMIDDSEDDSLGAEDLDRLYGEAFRNGAFVWKAYTEGELGVMDKVAPLAAKTA